MWNYRGADSFLQLKKGLPHLKLQFKWLTIANTYPRITLSDISTLNTTSKMFKMYMAGRCLKQEGCDLRSISAESVVCFIGMLRVILDIQPNNFMIDCHMKIKQVP
jgi:hypothetical protein